MWEYLGWFILIALVIAAFVIAVYLLCTRPCGPNGIRFGLVGSNPNPSAATSYGDCVTLEPADHDNPGLMGTGGQFFSGNKKFLGTLTTTNNTLDDGSGNGSFAGALDFKTPVVTLPLVAATNYTLTAAQSNSTILVGKQSAYTIFLPAVAAGLKFRFISLTVSLTTSLVAITGATGLMTGHWRQISGAATAATANTSINMTATGVIGDVIDLYSDGVAWYASGSTAVTAGMSFT